MCRNDLSLHICSAISCPGEPLKSAPILAEATELGHHETLSARFQVLLLVSRSGAAMASPEQEILNSAEVRYYKPAEII
ncbi:unnamed protein product [Dibothriocephalus latus]|uniref:Uncharacterized protein n=1 Tax=Dibothriocephalus latus TaxID=60516 RepID=A0A3P7LUZ0_DIBLA|nr:unnamed protein product [Dibothriocephalus latus]